MPAASVIGCQFWELIGCLSMTFSGVPGSNVAGSLDGTYLGPFTWVHGKVAEIFFRSVIMN